MKRLKELLRNNFARENVQRLADRTRRLRVRRMNRVNKISLIEQHFKKKKNLSLLTSRLSRTVIDNPFRHTVTVGPAERPS